MYRIDAARSRVKKDLRRIAAEDLRRIGDVVFALGDDPRPPGAVQLQKDVFRIRVGDYRVVYKVFEEEKLVLIGQVARRSEDTYKGMEDLFE